MTIAGPSCFLLLCPQTLPLTLLLALGSVEHTEMFPFSSRLVLRKCVPLAFAFSPVIPSSFFQHRKDL